MVNYYKNLPAGRLTGSASGALMILPEYKKVKKLKLCIKLKAEVPV